MNKTYSEIISVVRGDISRLESVIIEEKFFSEIVLKSLLQAPAKRIRSAIAFLFLRANGFEVTLEQLDLQCAVELAHTASLIHDDVVDVSNKRRGTETLNALYGDKYAILAGDYTLSVALKKIVALNNADITRNFLDVFSEMASGEISQLISNGQIPTLEEYLTKTKQKTAGLFKVSLKSAAMLAGLSREAEQWGNFAFNFGIAFQIKNDLKDIDADIKNGTYTAPVIFSQNPEEITTRAIQDTKNLINSYLIELEEYLFKMPQNKYSDALRGLLEYYKE